MSKRRNIAKIKCFFSPWVMLNYFLCPSGPFQSWLVTHIPWWQFHCMIHLVERLLDTLLTKVHKSLRTRTALQRRSGTKTLTCALRSVSAAISTVICDVPKKAQSILDCVNGKGKTVKRIVVMEVFETDLVTRAQECGIEIISLKELEVRLFIRGAVNAQWDQFVSMKISMTWQSFTAHFVLFSRHWGKPTTSNQWWVVPEHVAWPVDFHNRKRLNPYKFTHLFSFNSSLVIRGRGSSVYNVLGLSKVR